MKTLPHSLSGKPPPRPDDDEDVTDLPPLDGGEGETEPEPEYSDLLDPEQSDGADPFDDATGENEPVGDDDIEADGDDASQLDDAEDAEGLDLGTQDLLDLDAVLGGPADLEEPPPDDEDFGLGSPAEEASLLDAGEEGPEAEEEMVEDLPALDADNDGEAEDLDFFAPPQPLPPWSARPWEPAGAPLRVGPVRAVACVGRGLVAAGRRLIRVDLEGASEPLEALGLKGEVVQLAAGGDTLAALTAAGELFLSRDEGRTFEPNGAWRACTTESEIGRIVDLRMAADGLWVVTARREVLHSADGGVTWRGPTLDGAATALLGGGAEPVVVLTTAAAHGQTPRTLEAPREAHVVAGDLRGDAMACVTREGAVLRREDGRWIAVDGIAGARVVHMLDDAGALLAAVYVNAEDVTCLVAVDANGEAAVVAELGGLGARADDEESEARPYAIARDDAHGVVWVAGGFGIVAFEPLPLLASRGPVSATGPNA